MKVSVRWLGPDRQAELDELLAAVQVGEEPRPPRADQQERRTARDAGGFGHLPPVDQAVVVEELDAELCRSSAWGVELALEGVQVAVVVEGVQDGTVSLG
jgi:hypothetical protein